MTRLPVWRISVESFRLVLGRAPTFFRLGFPAFVLLLVCSLLFLWLGAGSSFEAMEEIQAMMERMEADYGAPPTEQDVAELAERLEGPMAATIAIQLLALIATLAAAAMATVAWCRYVARGDDRGGRWFAISFGAAEIEMFGVFLMLGIGSFVALVAIMAVAALAVSLVGLAGQAVMAVLVIALFLAGCRFSMLLPQAALGDGLSPLAAGRRTRCQTLRLFAIYGLIGLPFLVVLVAIQVVAIVVLVSVIDLSAEAPALAGQVGEMLMPFDSPTQLFLVSAAAVIPYLLFNGLALAVACAAMGLSHVRLEPAIRPDEFD